MKRVTRYTRALSSFLLKVPGISTKGVIALELACFELDAVCGEIHRLSTSISQAALNSAGMAKEGVFSGADVRSLVQASSELLYRNTKFETQKEGFFRSLALLESLDVNNPAFGKLFNRVFSETPVDLEE